MKKLQVQSRKSFNIKACMAFLNLEMSDQGELRLIQQLL